MNKTHFNFATVFSIMTLLAYAFFAFMGLVYWRNGELTYPLLFTIEGIAIVLLCVYLMCMGKESRWHTGRAAEIICGIIIFVMLLIAALPFTNFMKVVENQSDIKQKIGQLFDSATELDNAYDKYADTRIKKYESALQLVATGKAIHPSEYKELLADAAGSNDDDKIDGLSKSLRRQLLPDSIDTIRRQRTQWLENARDMSVWNMMLPTNINKIAAGVDNYVDNYTELSRTIRAGENATPFTYTALNNDLGSLQQIYTSFSKPSILSIILSVIAAAIMLLPYFVSQRSLAGAASNNKNDYE